jgi:hypothetical protein
VLIPGWATEYVIRRRYFTWWSKYNYTLSAALDVGTILSGIFIFLTLGLPKVSVDWIGNTIFQNTADWNGLPLLTPPPEGFGPDTCAYFEYRETAVYDPRELISAMRFHRALITISM